MAEFLKAVFPEIVGGLLAILCAIIGAKLATSGERRRDRRRELLDVYTGFFAAYYNFVTDDRSKEYSVQLIASFERLRLLCSKRSEKIIVELAPLLTSDPLQIDELAKKISLLREAAKEDLRHAERK